MRGYKKCDLFSLPLTTKKRLFFKIKLHSYYIYSNIAMYLYLNGSHKRRNIHS